MEFLYIIYFNNEISWKIHRKYIPGVNPFRCLDNTGALNWTEILLIVLIGLLLIESGSLRTAFVVTGNALGLATSNFLGSTFTFFSTTGSG